jgi:plasmid stability protein
MDIVMPGLLIKDFPPALHRKLKAQAERHHRSMTKEAIVLLEQSLAIAASREPPLPLKGKFSLTDAFIEQARLEGRE